MGKEKHGKRGQGEDKNEVEDVDKVEEGAWSRRGGWRKGGDSNQGRGEAMGGKIRGGGEGFNTLPAIVASWRCLTTYGGNHMHTSIVALATQSRDAECQN